MQKQKDEDAVTLQQTVDSVREELTKSMAGDSEEKFAAMEADFECSLAAAVAAEKKMAQNELLVFFFCMCQFIDLFCVGCTIGSLLSRSRWTMTPQL